MAKKNRGPRPPVVNVTTSVTQSVNAWDSVAFGKLLQEQAKSNQTAIKALESSMAQAGANQQQLAEQIAQTSMMKDIKDVLIAQLEDRKFDALKKEAIKLKEQEKLAVKEANDKLKENIRLREQESKAIAQMAKGMQTFETLGDKFQNMGKRLKDNFGSMSALKVTALKAFNIGGIFNKSIAKEKFIQVQRKLGSEDDRATLKDKFETANRAAIDIKKNEAEISKLKKDTGMSESDLAKRGAGKELFAKREKLSDTLAGADLRAASIKTTPTQQVADQGAQEERDIESAKHAENQDKLLNKIEENTRGASPDQKAKPAEDEKGGGILSGLMGGGKVGKALDGMKKFGVGLLAIAAALWVASKAFKSFGEVDWESIGKGIVGLTAITLAAVALDKLKGSVIKGAAVLGLLSLAMWGISESLGTFANLDWETIGKGMASVAGIAIVAAVMGAAIVPITKGAIAMGLLGGALWIIGEAMQAVGQGFQDMQTGLEKLANLDGENLLKVAAGIGAIGVAMAAFAAGNVMAGLGNLVTGFLSAVSGQKTPIEQIMMLGEKGDLINQAGTGVKNIATGLAMLKDVDPDKVKLIASLPVEKIAAAGALMKSSNAVTNGSKANADAAAAGSIVPSNNAVVVNAPVTNNTRQTHVIQSPIRNQDSSVNRYQMSRY